MENTFLKKEKNNNKIFVNIVFLFLGFLIFYSYNYYVEKKVLDEDLEKKTQQNTKEQEILKIKAENEKILENIFEKQLQIEAQSFLVYDLDLEEMIYQKNSDLKLPLASLTKVMTAIIALEEGNLDENIFVSYKHLEPLGEYGLILDESFTKKDVLEMSLISSSNDAARMLALGNQTKNSVIFSFIDKMNKKAKAIEATETFFFNESGLDVVENQRVSGSYGTAQDFLKIIKYFYNLYPLFSSEVTVYEKNIYSSFLTHPQTNTNKLLKEKDGFLFSKTGFTNLSGGNLATIYNLNGKKIITIVLGSPTKDSRFSDTEKLIEGSAKYFLQKR